MKGKFKVRPLTFAYHGIAPRELESAVALAEAARVAEHRQVRLPDLKEAGDIGGRRFAGYPRTYIPMRNSVFYSFAASYAEEVGASVIVGGHNRDDLEVFRDTSPEFFRELQKAFRAGSKVLEERKLRIERPLKKSTKAEVVRRADKVGVPFQLTWSCYREGRDHCWECDGCLARVRAFKDAGVRDPLMSSLEKIT
jgi:7-cyano-7-deazaguanine synthase